jgi:DNA invertase Pin-like site-specific DNA recombinase
MVSERPTIRPGKEGSRQARWFLGPDGATTQHSINCCHRRRVDAAVVFRYDRFARSVSQRVDALEEFRSLGIDFVSLHEGVNTSTSNGRLVFGIFASIAEFERELIRDRVRSRLVEARVKSKKLDRPRVVVDGLRIAELRGEGRSWKSIAAELAVGVGTMLRVANQSDLGFKKPLRNPSSKSRIFSM